MQPYSLPKIKLPEYIEPATALAEISHVEERRPNRCSLDSLPLELLREIVKQVAPRSVFDTQRTLARLVMVDKQLRYVLLEDARKTMWIYSAEQVDDADKIPQEVFHAATTLITTNDLSYVDRTHAYRGAHLKNKPKGLSGHEIGRVVRRLPRLQRLHLTDFYYLTSPGLRACPPKPIILTLPIGRKLASDLACEDLSSLLIRDSQVRFVLPLANEPVQLEWAALAFVGRSYWDDWYPDVLFDSDTVSFPKLRTLRLGVTYIVQYAAGFEIPQVSLKLLQQLDAVQLGIGSTDTDAFLDVPTCYLETSTPVLFDITSTWSRNIAKQTDQLQQFEYIQLRRLDPVNASAIYRALVDSPRLRVLFVAQSFVEEEYAQRDKPDNVIKTLWRLCDELKLKGGEVILCGPDDDEFILPEFLDYLKEHKDAPRA